MWLRRALTIPAYFVLAVAWIGAAPLWIAPAAAADLLRRSPGVALRSGTFLAVYLGCEVLGLVASLALWGWVRLGRLPSERSAELHHGLEAWWGATLFRAAARLFRLDVQVEGAREAQLARGPYLLLVRHASTADTVLASFLIARPLGMRLRYVLKRELLMDPCLDVVGNRIPNAFVDRDAEDSAPEIRRIQALARGLGPRDAVLIYPEGTRFSAQKRERVLARLRREGDPALAAYAEELRSVLPPRPGGTLGLLEAAPDADVVVCAHTGFEGTASLADLWRGDLVGRTVHVGFRRVPRDRIPREREARAAWLRSEWQRVDDWITRRGALGSHHPPSRAPTR